MLESTIAFEVYVVLIIRAVEISTNTRRLQWAQLCAVYRAYYAGHEGSSGSIVSNAEDMAEWMKLQLNRGTTPAGQEILTAAEFWVNKQHCMSPYRAVLRKRRTDVSSVADWHFY